MLSTTALVALSFLSSTSFAGDSVEQVAMGRNPSGEQVRLAVWTASGPATPEGVGLELAPYGSAPELPEARIQLSNSTATQQLWTVPGLAFTRDAHGGLYTVQVALWDEDARLVDELTVQVGAGGLAAGPDSSWLSGGNASAHLDLDDAGKVGQLSLALSGPATASVTTVSVELVADAGLVRPVQARHPAHLERVQQLWIATLDLPANAGDRYQVDGIVLDGTGSAYGTAFVTDLAVAPHMPGMTAPSPWGMPVDQRVALY